MIFLNIKFQSKIGTEINVSPVTLDFFQTHFLELLFK